jgi:hypothetical protein
LHRNCLLRLVIEGKIKEARGRRGRRRRKLQDDLKQGRGYSHLKEEALDRIMWRAHFGRSFGPVVRQITKQMNECGTHGALTTEVQAGRTIKSRHEIT